MIYNEGRMLLKTIQPWQIAECWMHSAVFVFHTQFLLYSIGGWGYNDRQLPTISSFTEENCYCSSHSMRESHCLEQRDGLQQYGGWRWVEWKRCNYNHNSVVQSTVTNHFFNLGLILDPHKQEFVFSFYVIESTVSQRNPSNLARD